MKVAFESNLLSPDFAQAVMVIIKLGEYDEVNQYQDKEDMYLWSLLPHALRTILLEIHGLSGGNDEILMEMSSNSWSKVFHLVEEIKKSARLK